MTKVFDQTGKEYTIQELTEMINSKSSVEYQRYKQDCRKRALDLAHAESTRVIINDPFNQQPNAPKKVNVTKLADEYYNWLISIPNGQ